MQENMLLRNAFVDFLKQMQPLVIDPLLIVHSHFKNFTKLLEDNSITTKTIVEFIEKLKFKPQQEKSKVEKIISQEPNTLPQQLTVPTIPLSKITQSSSNKPVHRRCTSNKIGLISQRNRVDVNTLIEMPIPTQPESQETSILQISQPSTCSIAFKFNKFLTIQDDKKFSLVSKEYLLDGIEIAMKEFRRNSKTLSYLAEKTSEVNTSESNDVDKALKKQDYDFSSYAEKLHQNQKQNENQLRKQADFNILSKYKKVDKGL